MTRKNILFTSNPMLIGKHEWRILIAEHQLYSRPEGTFTLCTSYQWRTAVTPYRSFAGQWHEAQTWPQYDHNDTYDGLPRSISRLYKRNLSEINRHFGRSENPPALF